MLIPLRKVRYYLFPGRLQSPENQDTNSSAFDAEAKASAANNIKKS